VCSQGGIQADHQHRKGYAHDLWQKTAKKTRQMKFFVFTKKKNQKAPQQQRSGGQREGNRMRGAVEQLVPP